MPETQKTISRFPSFLTRSLALFVCVSLVPLTPPAAASSIQEPSSLSFKFDVPDHLGRIEEFVPGDSGRTVYFIQDAHDSLEAQENIAALIHHLVQKEGVDKVFEEGYEGPVPSDTYFGGIQDPDIREKVSYYFMDKLLLGGAEYAHINRDEDFELIGADSIRLHFDNVEAYQSVLRVQDESARDLEVLASELRSLSDEVFGNSLKTWMKLKARHEAGEIDFLDYLRRTRALRAKPQKDAFPLLDLILKDSRNDQENSLLDRVDAKAVFAEQERLESALAADYLAKEDDLRLFHALRGVQLLQRLNKLSVSAAEYSAVHGVLRECETRTLARFIVQKTGRTLVLSRDWEENLKPAFRFYETALSRDTFIEKALSRHASSKSVLVYGGFHLPGIREILKRRGDSFYVLSPKITSASGKHAEYYRELMAGGFSRLAIPGIVSKAAVAPRAYEFTALDNSQNEVFVELLRSAESAVKKLPEAERGRLSAEVDLILAQKKPQDPMPLSSLRSELRTNDDGKKENLGKLFSRLGNQLDGNTLSPEWVDQKNYGGLLLQIQERLDFVIMSVRENDYFSVRRAIESIRKDLPEDGVFDGARETLSEIHTLLADSRSELRDSKGEEEDLSSAQIHAYRLARERKVVGLPYFAKHHRISFAEASKALINAGFESLGPSEVGEQFVHPFTREDEARLLKENEPAGEDEDKTNPILRAGMEINAFKELLENITVQDPRRPVILSAIPSELKDASDPEKKVFIFRENMIHGLNNVATYLMFSPRSVTYYMMLDTADDLWATLKVLDDITARPVNDYPQISENLKDLLYTRNAATRTGAGAVESAAAGQFSELHYAEIRALRGRLEKVYGRVVELVIQREKEYLLREESRREAAQKWDGTEGIVFSARDLSFAGQVAQEDLQRLKQVLSASREDLKRLVKENPGELYFKAEDGLFEEEGRSVYLKLKVPVDVFSRGRKKQIDRLRIKGLKPAVDVRGTSVYLGRGSVQNRIIPGADGSLQSVPDTQSPKGGIRASSARQEYEVMKRALDAKRFETDYPVAWGIFEGFPFLGEDTGFVIAGLDGEDMRLSTTPGDEPSEVLFSAAPVQRKSGGEMDDDSARVLFEAFGRSLRAYHDEGFYHGFPHLGNIGVRLVKGRFEIILRDLNTTKIRSADMTREEETAYRFIDTADFVVRLLNRGKENFSEPFLKGYFHGFDHDTEVFRKMTDAVRDLSFLVEFLRLDDSLPPAVQMDDGRILQIREKYPPLQTLKINQEHPEFGALWENLTAAVQNRSELRYDDGLISFLHDHVFIHRYGHYEILADYRYADLEAIDQETLRLTAEKPAAVLPGPFRVVLLNAYQSETGEGRKNPHIVILSDDSEKPTAWGFVTLQDAAVFLDGMDDPSLFSPGESLDDSYFVTRTDIFADYYGQALMQRAVTALLLKGAIRKWIPSSTQLYPSRRMYERMKADSRLVLQGSNRVKLVTARSELREESEIPGKSILAGQPTDKELLRRLSTIKFPDFLISSTAYLLLSPGEKTVIKFFDPAPPFTMHSDPLWKFWVRGALKTLLGWHSRRLKPNYGEGYETMARYRLEYPGLPSHVRTRVLRNRDAFRLIGVPPLVRAALAPHRLWVVQDYVPQSWFVSQRILKAVQAGESEKAREVLDVSLNYLKSFWKYGYTDADLGINMLENYLIAGPEGAGQFKLSDVDFHDQGAFTDDEVQIKRFFDGVQRSVERIGAGMRGGKPLYSVLEDMGKEKSEYPFGNILSRVYSLLPEHPDDADVLARHFLDRVRAEFTFENWHAERVSAKDRFAGGSLAGSQKRAHDNALGQRNIQNVGRSELRSAENVSPHVVELYDLQKNDLRILFNESASGHFRFDLVNRRSYWDRELFEHALGGEENDPLGRRVNKPWAELEAELGPLGYREADVYSYHNLYYVDWFVLYDGTSKKLYHREGEPLAQRSYSMFVNWKGNSRAPTSEDLSFEEDGGGIVKVYRTSDPAKTDISSDIQQAFFGQRVFHEGQVTPFEEIAHQFEDIFQIYLFPQFMEAQRNNSGQVESYVYKESLGQRELVRLRDEDRESFKKVIRQDGRMKIDLSPYLKDHSQEDLERHALENPFRKYVKVTPRPIEELASGEYYIEGGELSVHLKRFPYPHNLVGVTRQGKAVAFVIIGDKFEGKGTAAQELGNEVQRLYSEKMKGLGKSPEEDPLTAVFLLANSRDAMQRKWKDGVGSIAAASARPYPSSTGALVFAKIEAGSEQVTKGEIGNQEDLVRQISGNWETIRERGFFMFDMQKTLAARRKPATEGMIKLLAWMLEEKVRLVINSGNPMKDVSDQIIDPLKAYLAADGKTNLLAGFAFSVYSASGTVFVTFDEAGNAVAHPDYEAGLVIARPVLEKSIHDVLVEFGKKKFGLDAAGIEKLRAAYIKDASKNSGLIYELPWADTSEAYEPSRVHFDDLGSKAMRVSGPYIQLRGSRVTEEEATSITITKLPSEIRPAIMDRLKELLKERLGADFVNRLSISVGGESSIDIFSADANKAKALIHYVETAAAKSDRSVIETSYGYYFGDELTGNVHGSTMENEVHKGNDMIVAEYPFPDPKYGQIKLASLSPDLPSGFASRDTGRLYWAGREDAGTEELIAKIKAAVETLRGKSAGEQSKSASGRSELRIENELIARWNQSSSEEKKKMLDAGLIKENLKSEALEDWLMYVLLDPDFVNRRRVVELNNWNPGLLIDPEVLLKHLSLPWQSLEKYGEPEMPPGQEFNEIQALRNKRMTLLILLVERVAEDLTSRLVLDSEEARAYVIKIRDALASQVKLEAQDWIENFDAKYESLKLAQARNPDFAIGEKRPMSFLDVFMLEAARYSFKSARDQYRDSYGWFHDDYFFSFVYALRVPELRDLLNRLEERIEEGKRTGSKTTVLADRTFPESASRQSVEKAGPSNAGQNLTYEMPKSENSRSELRSYGEASLDDAIFDLTRAEDADLRREALGELRKLTMQKRLGLDDSSPAKKDKQAAQLLSLLADPDSGVRNGAARVISRIDNFSFERILGFLSQPVIDQRYSERADYSISKGIFNARIAALFALAGTMKEDRLLRRDLRWPVFAASLNPDVFEENSKLPGSAGQARSLLESPGKQPLTALFAAGMFMQGPWKYAREAVGDLLPSLPGSAAAAVLSSEAAVRSELRHQDAVDVRRMIENTAAMPANLFISYEDIRSPEKPVYEDLFALAYLTRSDKNTRVVIYGVDAEDMMEERIKQLRDTAGVLMMQGSLQDAYQLYGRENPLQTKEGGTHSVHWSMAAERLKNQPGDLLSFLASSEQDLYAALLLARSGGELPGVSKGREGFYSVTENFLREELQRFQASLVIERAA